MLRLHKAAIITSCVSENVKRKLYSCCRICGRTFHNYLCGYSCIIFFLHLLIPTAWWWLFCAVEACSYYCTFYNKTFLSTNYVLIIVCCTNPTGSHNLRLMRLIYYQRTKMQVWGSDLFFMCPHRSRTGVPGCGRWSDALQCRESHLQGSHDQLHLCKYISYFNCFIANTFKL